MLLDQIKTYRNIITLRDGVNVLMRPLTSDDEQQLLDLFVTASDQDARYLRDNIRDPALVRSWCKNLDYGRVLPLLALVKDRAVGEATLHFRSGPERHIGEVRIFLAKDFRRRGLGTKMLQTLIGLARKQNLYQLVAEVVTNQPRVVKAFQNLGFDLRCNLDDYFMLPDGELCDVSILSLYLLKEMDEF